MVQQVMLSGGTPRVLISRWCSWWPEITSGLAGRLGKIVDPKIQRYGTSAIELLHFMGKALCRGPALPFSWLKVNMLALGSSLLKICLGLFFFSTQNCRPACSLLEAHPALGSHVAPTLTPSYCLLGLCCPSGNAANAPLVTVM